MILLESRVNSKRKVETCFVEKWVKFRVMRKVKEPQMRRFILDYVFWTNFFQGSVYFRLVKTMYFGLSPGHVVFYTSLKECTLG